MAHLCALKNDIDTAKILLKAGSNFEDIDFTDHGFNPLHTTIIWSSEPSLEFVKFLVEEVQVDIGITDGEDKTAAELAFAKASKCKGIFYYLEYRSGSTTTLIMEYRTGNFLFDWMDLETCCTLM